MPYETFDHTADLGLIISSESLEGIFEEARKAFYDIVFNQTIPQGNELLNIELEAQDTKTLLISWLNEILYYCFYKKIFISKIKDLKINKKNFYCQAIVWHDIKQVLAPEMEVKAATYHGLDLKQDGNTWKAKVILDV